MTSVFIYTPERDVIWHITHQARLGLTQLSLALHAEYHRVVVDQI